MNMVSVLHFDNKQEEITFMYNGDIENWSITKRSKWIAEYLPTGELFFANSKNELMQKINKLTKTN